MRIPPNTTDVLIDRNWKIHLCIVFWALGGNLLTIIIHIETVQKSIVFFLRNANSMNTVNLSSDKYLMLNHQPCDRKTSMTDYLML